MLHCYITLNSAICGPVGFNIFPSTGLAHYLSQKWLNKDTFSGVNPLTAVGLYGQATGTLPAPHICADLSSYMVSFWIRLDMPSLQLS